MKDKLVKIMCIAALGLGTISSAFALSADEAQNTSFNGANLINQPLIASSGISHESEHQQAAPVTLMPKSASNLGGNKQYAIPLNNGKVDLSDDTHVAIYTSATGGTAVLQMQY